MANVGFQPLAFQADTFASDVPPIGPTLVVRVDWSNNGTFTDALDSCTGRVLDDVSYTRGRSADFSGEATGSASFKLDNFDDRYSPDRNWHDNPSFESGTTGWATTAIASLTAAATSIASTPDAGVAGVWAGAAVLTGTVNSGVAYAIPYLFRSGAAYSISVWLKSISGNLNVQAGMASAGTPADIATSSVPITTSWAQYSFSWTPSADRADGVFFVRTTTAAAATVRIDACQVNPGATANPYIEGPTKGQLVPGRPVHIYATYNAVDYPQFFGYIERLTNDPIQRICTFTCYDVLRPQSERDVVVAGSTLAAVTAREFRLAILSDYERGNLNFVENPEFAANTRGWDTTVYGGAISRIAGDAPPGAGITCGEYVTTVTNQAVKYFVRLSPVLFQGQVYRLSIWLRATSGTPRWDLELGVDDGGAGRRVRQLTLSTSWTRYTLTFKMTATIGANGSGSGGFLHFRVINASLGASTIRIGGAAVTRGQGDYAYAAVGTGRPWNMCGNGGFDAGLTTGWSDPWANLIANPSFEVNTTGWTAVSGPLTRVATSPLYGSWCGSIPVVIPTVNGIDFIISGTFKLGVTYDAQIWMRVDAGGAINATLSLGNGADTATSGAGAVGTSWVARNVSWTPTADRVNATLSARLQPNSGPITAAFFDGAMVTRRSGPGSVGNFTNVGPGGAGGSTLGISTSTPKYGSGSLSVTTTAVANQGAMYDFHSYGSYPVPFTYTLSLWLRCDSGSLPYKVGVGGNAGPSGIWDEATTTGTASVGVWTRVTLSWTPAQAIDSIPFQNTGIYVYQTDAVARTFLVAGVRMIAGPLDDFEMTHWNVTADESADVWSSSAAFSGAALGGLSTANGLTLSRHWINAAMAAPWYRYNVEGRVSLRTKASAETYDDDVADMSIADIDRISISNNVAVTSFTGTEFYGDAASAAAYGDRPGAAINGSLYFPDSTIPDVIGPALVARYRIPRARPKITVENRWPSQLQRELNDLITVNFARLRISGGRYVILRIDSKVSDSGQRWTTSYILEEYTP